MDTSSGSSREKKTLDPSTVRPVPSRRKNLQLAGKNQNKSSCVSGDQNISTSPRTSPLSF
ncbi:hypothetical protein A2U01_0108455 [Trifolium medium]|uniref:Uncharacterized protein n=1 Tax=Trifolium medium TaxID=97028 RepID=A0A392VFN0_9FABA|nr:hypothetical protein [Trifolium medium]